MYAEPIKGQKRKSSQYSGSKQRDEIPKNERKTSQDDLHGTGCLVPSHASAFWVSVSSLGKPLIGDRGAGDERVQLFDRVCANDTDRERICV